MSEAKKSFMEELDEWSEATIIEPLHAAITEGDGDDCDAAREAVKKAIREKVLESYRNGLKAPAKTATRPASTQRGARKWK